MNHRKALWVMAVALLYSNPCAAEYLPPTLYQLAAGSDLIVLGRIVALDEVTFTLSVEEVLAGTTSDSLVYVARFQDWMCSQRWEPYAIGQREIAFLCGDKRGYRTNSGGAEGEWHVIGSQVTCAYFSNPAIPSPPNVLSLRKVVSALKDFTACVDLDWQKAPSRAQGGIQLPPGCREIIEERCSTEQIAALALRSELHRYLVETLRAAQKGEFGGGETLCSHDECR